jgi:hypothetical protein
MSNTRKIRQKILDTLVSPKTAAWLKMGIAVIGIVSAFNELRSAERRGIRFDHEED